MDIEKIVRPEAKNFVPYIPGKPIEELRRELNIKNKTISKLASNENPLQPPKKVLYYIKKSLSTVNRYPESSCYYLRKALSKKLQVKESEIIFGAGSDEIIELLGKTFLTGKDEIVVSEHAFIRYKMAGELMGCKVITVPMDKNLKHDLEQMAKYVNKKTKIVFIANPNNPTGTYNNENEMKNFIEEVIKRNENTLIVCDQAYYEYARSACKDYPDTVELYKAGYKNVITLRTFSKIYSLAGLRIGYAVCAEEIINYLDRIRPPFNVSAVAQAAALASLKDTQHIKESIKLVNEGKKFLYAEFDKLGIEYIPSATNFILAKINNISGKEVFNRLLKFGIIIRAVDEYGLPQYFRVTIGTKEENYRLIRTLKRILPHR
jgi:histidinol-phosphate aminotransferase